MLYLRTRVRSFSLIEMLVVLILSGLMVGIIYLSFYNVSTYHLNLIQKQRTAQDISSLHFLIKRDALKSRSIIADSELSLSCGSENGNTVRYIFDSLFVLRTQMGRIDTFHVFTEKPLLYFDQEPVTTYPGAVDAIEIGVKQMPVPLNIRIFKSYDVASLITLTNKDSLP